MRARNPTRPPRARSEDSRSQRAAFGSSPDHHRRRHSLTPLPLSLFAYSQDKLTSVAIPLTLAGVATGLLVKGLDDLYHGKNRKEGF